MLEWVSLALLGFGAGAFGVIVGAGGGFIIGPLFILVFRVEPRVAVGTALALAWVNSVFGTVSYSRQRRIDFRSGILFAIAATPGSVLGAQLLKAVSGDLFRVLFGVLLVGLATLLALRPPVESGRPVRLPPHLPFLMARRRLVTRAGDTHEYEYNRGVVFAFNIMLGFISSFFGIGGGFLLTPALVYAFNFPVKIATATSIFALSLYTAVGAGTHLALGNVSFFPLLVFTGVGIVLGAQVGASLSRFLTGPWILRLLAVALGVLGVQLILRGVLG
ncbi:MAG: sulfite exporter TauE/SafE family protein [Chloroflexi bacterium]|nr:sulfite exporter TauE/SafE family protein [Chloroflexota bacterium]